VRPGQQPAKGIGVALPYTVLIADDSAAIRDLLRCRIERDSDWQICGEAENGEAVLEKVKELRPDAVILDFEMPVMNGLETARQITRLAPNTAVVMLTGHNSDQLLKDARAAGIKDVLSKSDGSSKRLLASLRNAVLDARITSLTAWSAVEGLMENFAQLMQRLLELQSDGKLRSPELIAEDERLLELLQKRTLAERTVKLSQNSRERT